MTAKVPRPSSTGDPKIFVLRRELSEVHLLLDNISSSSEKTIPVGDAPEPLGKEWLRRLCGIEWPSITTDEPTANEAELLIRAKDYLNGLAKPASGLTIAFTHLVTQDGNDIGLRRILTGYDLRCAEGDPAPR